MTSDKIILVIMGALLTIDTGMLLFMLKGYMTFRNTLHKELSEEFVLRKVCEAQRFGIVKDIERLEDNT